MANETLKPKIDEAEKVSFQHPEKGPVWMKYQMNPLINAVMWWWSDSNSMYGGSFTEVKTILRNIAKKHSTYTAEYTTEPRHPNTAN